jgi:hypothetical protein
VTPYALHLARHHLSLTHLQPEPRQPYDDALEAVLQRRLGDTAYDPAWFAAPANRRKVHPHRLALMRGESNPATDARTAAAAACWAWLSRSVQLDLFAGVAA